MTRAMFVPAAILLCSIGIVCRSSAQASKQLEQRTKESQAAQEKSWNQVDQINRDADKTTTRLQQSRTSSTESIQNARSPVKKMVIGTASPYAKSKRLTKSPPKAKQVAREP